MKFLLANALVAGADDGDIGVAPPYDPSPPAVTETLPYVLSAKIDKNFLQFYYSKTPKGYVNNDKMPLLLRVPRKNCEISLTLDQSSINWRFPLSVPALRLGDKSNPDTGLPDPADRYKNCLVLAGQQTLTFNAKHVDLLDSAKQPINNFDGINIIVEISQGVGDDGVTPSYDKPLVLIIDPDIKNPGDDTLPIDMHSAGRSRKKAVRKSRK